MGVSLAHTHTHLSSGVRERVTPSDTPTTSAVISIVPAQAMPIRRVIMYCFVHILQALQRLRMNASVRPQGRIKRLFYTFDRSDLHKIDLCKHNDSALVAR
jgi:hypothetical protein